MDENENPIRPLLEKQDWGDIYARLLEFAEHRCKSTRSSDALAKDLAQGAITRVFAYDSKWDPRKEPDLLRYLMSVVNSLLANERTRAASTRTRSMEESKRARAVAEAVKDDRAFSEAKMADHDLFTRRLALLSERLAGDPQALRIVELLVDGIDSPTEIRRLTGWTADAVMAARRRMLRSAALVARDLGAPSDDEALASAADSDSEPDEVA